MAFFSWLATKVVEFLKVEPLVATPEESAYTENGADVITVSEAPAQVEGDMDKIVETFRAVVAKVDITADDQQVEEKDEVKFDNAVDYAQSDAHIFNSVFEFLTAPGNLEVNVEKVDYTDDAVKAEE